ncbi:hypothetical protein SAMN06273570_2784 [Candidatus Pantoea floridensis]|uniref:Uncharacterized protein n=1 Tax=Candidatus Pantoea floridensis TaxID=1938870 RepID=A0A286BW49_9GAMM|nr:hypothetical protein BX596_0225 [Enterobacteriaceae bacterium JKS000233]SOD38377.1 hypothetical protein SAMN06273570_2784 [Pantoea floridensis]
MLEDSETECQKLRDIEEVMVHPGGLLGYRSPFGPLLKQRYPP